MCAPTLIAIGRMMVLISTDLRPVLIKTIILPIAINVGAHMPP